MCARTVDEEDQVDEAIEEEIHRPDDHLGASIVEAHLKRCDERGEEERTCRADIPSCDESRVRVDCRTLDVADARLVALHVGEKGLALPKLRLAHNSTALPHEGLFHLRDALRIPLFPFVLSEAHKCLGARRHS